MSTVPVARRDLAALVLAATCWGVGTVISKAALDEVPPLTLLPIQLAASLAILGVLMRRQGISFRSEGSPLLGRLGLLNPGAAYALSLLGLDHDHRQPVGAPLGARAPDDPVPGRLVPARADHAEPSSPSRWSRSAGWSSSSTTRRRAAAR